MNVCVATYQVNNQFVWSTPSFLSFKQVTRPRGTANVLNAVMKGQHSLPTPNARRTDLHKSVRFHQGKLIPNKDNAEQPE